MLLYINDVNENIYLVKEKTAIENIMMRSEETKFKGLKKDDNTSNIFNYATFVFQRVISLQSN